MLILLFFAAWFFILGSIFGSFLNVVVWRLPQKMSLSFPASHCPKCKHPIRFRHNVPILGWCILRGRCKDCRAPISFRYPAVEFLTGVAFAVLAILAPYDSLWSWPLLILDWMFFLTFLASGLILWDRQTLPPSLFLPVWLLWGGICLFCKYRLEFLLILLVPLLLMLVLFAVPVKFRRFFGSLALFLGFLWCVKQPVLLYLFFSSLSS